MQLDLRVIVRGQAVGGVIVRAVGAVKRFVLCYQVMKVMKE